MGWDGVGGGLDYFFFFFFLTFWFGVKLWGFLNPEKGEDE